MIASARAFFRRATGGLALAIRAPADGWLAARMLAWRAILPALKHLLPLRRLVRLMDAGPARGERRAGRAQRVVAVADRVFDGGRSGDDCLELSLVTYRYLTAAGADPRLVIAIRNDGAAAHGHAWVTVEGVPVHDSPSRLEEFASVITFESGGRGLPR
jgi:Transglutaminase-like superfamily